MDYISHRDASGAHDLYHNGDHVQATGYLTDLLAERAVQFIRQFAAGHRIRIEVSSSNFPR